MIKTYEIDLDDTLVDSASKIFEALGTDVDAAISIFLNQAVLRKGFPFDVVIPEADDADGTIEETPAAETQEESAGPVAENLSADDTIEETSDAVPSISPEVAARVAANETLVAQMKDEIGDRIVTPEFDENEDDGTHGDYDSTPTAEKKESEYEDEDEETPENLFAAWGTR
ncbi:MAG: type II toxin-antitoxin system RelB/DinJ family antitoxin [Treponema sp.]|nr:type II toxin-antitoxin system RelB/DinJ family antitoxin [Treponema sp.]